MQEYNFDGLVGPNHCFAGLSAGNLASKQHQFNKSSPKKAALQGLKKMKTLHDMGFKQAVLPPLIRPDLTWLSQLGFSGSDRQLLQQVWQQSPQLAMRCFSASSMWVANAATIGASVDSANDKLQITAANLNTMLHRSIEVAATSKILKTIFANPNYFEHHRYLPQNPAFSDEGAANHTRFCKNHNSEGVNFYVYNRSINDEIATKFPSRQTLEASQAIARTQNIKHSLFAMQNPLVVDKGVFHNDVIAVGSCNLLFCHQLAFAEQAEVYRQLQQKMQAVAADLEIIEVADNEIDVATAVKTYLFNSQLLKTEDGFHLVVPIECKNNATVHNYLTKIVAFDNSIVKVHYFDLTQSMDNGGGPACLRIRIPLTAEQSQNISGKVILNDELYKQLCAWVDNNYRDSLCLNDLKNPDIIYEFKNCLMQLKAILGLPNLYDN